MVTAIASELAQPPAVGFDGKNTETKPILAKAAGVGYDDSEAVGGQWLQIECVHLIVIGLLGIYLFF